VDCRELAPVGIRAARAADEAAQQLGTSDVAQPRLQHPRWGFVTCLIYLPRPDDLETWGTKLYAVDEDREARNTLPHWIDERQCRLVAEVPFRRNTALVFMNSAGAHGASISDDAEPPDLQRYAYQFRIGPTRESITELLKLLPEDRRAAWSGKMDF
jgi:hypothetical protein